MIEFDKLALFTDFYELTMGNGYLVSEMEEKIAYFDVFFRKIPDNGGYAIFAGLEQIINYIENLKFSDEDLKYIRSRGIFSEEFIEYLKNFEFKCDIWSFKEGDTIFPHEPVMVVRGPVLQVQLMETLILTVFNHESLIATKASRIVNAAKERKVTEFGSRRAHGTEAAVYGARATYIGGCIGTSNTLAGKMFGIPALGTMAHSWVQFFDTEYEAFKTYAEIYPDSCNLLIDTYDILNSGLPNAIKVFDEIIVPKGYRPKGVRIDSGDITYLSKIIRKRLDEAGYEDVTIMASNSLDEYIISSLISQGAKIDSYGVGERMITAKSDPTFGGVYKLSAVEEDGKIIPRIKISETSAKITNPGFKQVWRFYDNESCSPVADLISLHDEDFEGTDNLEIFHPIDTWKRKTLKNYTAKPMLSKIYDNGKLIYNIPTLEEVREYSLNAVNILWDEQKRLEYANIYIVDLSEKLWRLKKDLLKQHRKIQE